MISLRISQFCLCGLSVVVEFECSTGLEIQLAENVNNIDVNFEWHLKSEKCGLIMAYSLLFKGSLSTIRVCVSAEKRD